MYFDMFCRLCRSVLHRVHTATHCNTRHYIVWWGVLQRIAVRGIVLLFVCCSVSQCNTRTHAHTVAHAAHTPTQTHTHKTHTPTPSTPSPPTHTHYVNVLWMHIICTCRWIREMYCIWTISQESALQPIYIVIWVASWFLKNTNLIRVVNVYMRVHQENACFVCVHTHTHTPTFNTHSLAHALAPRHTHTHACMCLLSLSLSLILSLVRSLSLSPFVSLSLWHIHTHKNANTRSRSFFLCHSLSLSLPVSLSHVHTHTYTYTHESEWCSREESLNTRLHCNKLQHTATQCVTLHHTCATYAHILTSLNEVAEGSHGLCILDSTATHCNTMQHTATRCNAPQHTATHLNTHPHSRIGTRMWRGLH